MRAFLHLSVYFPTAVFNPLKSEPVDADAAAERLPSVRARILFRDVTPNYKSVVQEYGWSQSNEWVRRQWTKTHLNQQKTRLCRMKMKEKQTQIKGIVHPKWILHLLTNQHFLIPWAILEFQGLKEFHLVDACGNQRLQCKKNMSPYCLCSVIKASGRPRCLLWLKTWHAQSAQGSRMLQLIFWL